MTRILIAIIMTVCALQSRAQTLTATYIELADSADHYIKLQKWEDAERVIVKALRHEPANKSNYLLWSNLGMVRNKAGNYEGSLEAYDIGLAMAPKSTTLLSNRASTHLALGNRKEALEDLDKALELDSTLQWPRKMRGLIRTSDGNRKGALRDFEIYSKQYGNDASVSEAKGDIAVAEGDIDSAITDYREAYRLEPDAALLEKSLVAAYMYGKLEDMEDDLAEGLKVYPRNGNLYLLRAMLDKMRYQNSAMEKDLKIAKEFGADERLYNTLTGAR